MHRRDRPAVVIVLAGGPHQIHQRRASAQRIASLREVAPMAEVLPDVDFSAWYGLIEMPGDRQAFAGFIQSEIGRWQRIVKLTGAKPA